MVMQSESIGCLLLGETKRMRALRTKLYREGIDPVSMLRGGDMLGAAMGFAVYRILCRRKA